LLSYKNRLEEANAKLLDLAVTDPLTGLYNRRKFEETIHQEVQRALRYGPVSLLMIDLDKFKQVNDSYGHPAGDDVLRTVSQVLLSSCRATDTCARLGGDEFAMILPHSDFAAAEVVRNRIHTQIGNTTVQAGEIALRISLSIGIATLASNGEDAASLIAAADAAMYQAKQNSRSARPSAENSPVSSCL
jgi:diguanylate cyclase (GGDEF)-like protein